MSDNRFLFVAAAAGLIAVACTQASIPADGSAKTPPGNDAGVSGTQQTDWAAIEQLEKQAKAIAKTEGCSTSSQCRSAPVGSKGCGGPRYYIPWCAKTTDSAALYARLDEVVAAERAYNKKYNIVSSCEYRVAPTVEVVAGACTAR
jgi:hypothetical protein